MALTAATIVAISGTALVVVITGPLATPASNASAIAPRRRSG
jgi:hypothetical protein